MRIKSSAVLLGVTVLAVAAGAAGARAHPRAWDVTRDGATRAVVARAPQGGLLARAPMLPAPAPAPGMEQPHDAPPFAHSRGVDERPVDEPDWSNPYDLMLRGIPPGPTRDMR
jgi:hypothetical protein